jgi:hypothetical protein
MATTAFSGGGGTRTIGGGGFFFFIAVGLLNKHNEVKYIFIWYAFSPFFLCSFIFFLCSFTIFSMLLKSVSPHRSALLGGLKRVKRGKKITW